MDTNGCAFINWLSFIYYYYLFPLRQVVSCRTHFDTYQGINRSIYSYNIKCIHQFYQFKGTVYVNSIHILWSILHNILCAICLRTRDF